MELSAYCLAPHCPLPWTPTILCALLNQIGVLDLVTALANCEAVGNHHMRSQGQLCLHGQYCACSALCFRRTNCTEAKSQQRVPRRPGSVVCFPAQAAVIREPPQHRDPLQSHSPIRRRPRPPLYGGADAPRTASKGQADDERGRAQVSLQLLALAFHAASPFQSMTKHGFSTLAPVCG